VADIPGIHCAHLARSFAERVAAGVLVDTRCGAPEGVSRTAEPTARSAPQSAGASTGAQPRA
jgi:hypothetical protein